MYITKDAIIYILCPANVVTGGPEALHQLRFYMEKCSLNAKLAYYGKNLTNPTPSRYEQYDPKFVLADQIIDNENNVVIAPESATYLLNGIQHCKKCVWWLGATAYDGKGGGLLRLLKALRNFQLTRKLTEVKKVFSSEYKPIYPASKRNRNVLHFCASKYAYQYVSKKFKLEPEYLVEPISLNFLEYNREHQLDNLSASSRNDVILYNPSKPSKIMNKLVKLERFEFKPLKGMTPLELIDTYRCAKLYIDFGEFGGPERIPKETVYNGCVILVANHNAAKNDFDVAIPEKFKLSDYNDVEIVSSRIKDALENYDLYVNEFESFRQKINSLENNFIGAIKRNFVIKKD